MNEQINAALESGNYRIEYREDCGCYIDWYIQSGDLVCDVSSDACYESKALMIGDKCIAEKIRFGEMHVYEDVDEDLIPYEKLSMRETVEPWEYPDPPSHVSKSKSVLKDYLSELSKDGWTLYLDPMRGFANEFGLIIKAPNAEIPYDEDKLQRISVDTFVEKYFDKGDAVTTVYSFLEIFE